MQWRIVLARPRRDLIMQPSTCDSFAQAAWLLFLVMAGDIMQGVMCPGATAAAAAEAAWKEGRKEEDDAPNNAPWDFARLQRPSPLSLWMRYGWGKIDTFTQTNTHLKTHTLCTTREHSGVSYIWLCCIVIGRSLWLVARIWHDQSDRRLTLATCFGVSLVITC